MKLAKIKVYLGLVFFLVSITLGILPVQQPHVSAASSKPVFVGSDNTSLPSPQESQFTFLSPFQIRYTNPTDNSTTDYWLKGNQCQTQAYQSDAMYLCQGDSGDTFASTHGDRGFAYWYWPSSDTSGSAVTSPDSGSSNPCVSALVMGMGLNTGANDGEELTGATLSVVTPRLEKNASGTGQFCSVSATKGGSRSGAGQSGVVVTGSMEGTGVAVVSTSHVYSEATLTTKKSCDGSANGTGGCIVDSSNIVVSDLINHNNSAQDRETLLGLGTTFYWTDQNTLTSYLDGSITDTKVTNPTVLTDIQKGFQLSDDSVAKTYNNAATYDYYTNQAGSNDCYNSAGTYWSAIIAVDPSDPSQAQVLWRDGGGWHAHWVTGSYSAQISESSGYAKMRCLFQSGSGGDNVHFRSSPSEVWMNPGDQRYDDEIGLGNPQTYNDPNAVVAKPPGGGGGGGGDTDTPSVHCDVSFNPLTWFLCPIANLLVSLASDFDNAVNSYLCIQPDQSLGLSSCSSSTITDTNSSSSGSGVGSYKQAWAGVRDLALGLIVVIGLVAIISQASGMDIFDAYTIKKTMPRLLIAAVAISVSWPLMNWFIQLSNDLGFGVRVLIYKSVGITTANFTAGSGFINNLFIGGGFISLLGIGGLLSFGATAALFGAVAFLVLTIRQIAIIALVIAGPLAIMLYAAPYGQKLAARWWQEFLQLTMAFPIVAGAIAIGHVFGAIGVQNNGTIGQLLGFTAYFAGDIAILGILAKRGAIMGAATSAAQKAARPAFASLSKRRSARMTDRLKRARSGGNIWQKNSGMVGISADSRLGRRLAKSNNRLANSVVGKQFSIGNAANKLAEWGLDADELTGAFLGSKLKIPGLAGYARKAEAKIAHERSHQIAKYGSETFGHLQHQTKSLMTGDYSGLDMATQDEIAAAIGSTTDSNGNRVINKANSAPRMQKVSEILSKHSDIKTRSIGGDLDVARKFAESVNTGENHRANGYLDLAAAVSLAQEGRLTGKNMTKLLNEHHGTALGAEMHGIFAQVSQKRPDLRIGHGVMEGSDGEMVYVFDKNQWDKDPSVYQAAVDNALSMDTAQIGGAKGEMFKEEGFTKVTKDILDGTYVKAGKTRAEEEKRKIEVEQYKQKLFAAAGPYGHNATDAQAAIVGMFDEATKISYKVYSDRNSGTAGEINYAGGAQPNNQPTIPGMEDLGGPPGGGAPGL